MDIAESILYEDAQLLICHKQAGTAVQTRNFGEQDMESLLRNYLAGKGEKPYIGIVHRLDQPVEGVMVFSKNPKAAAVLNKQMQGNGFGKYYLAVVHGHLPDQFGTLTHFLRKDGRKNMSFLAKEKEPEAKKAVLHYEVVEEKLEESLVKIKLETGRHHQIRVQMASVGCPLAGDVKYAFGSGNKTSNEHNTGETVQKAGLALCSYRIEFLHPVSNKPMQFQIEPKGVIFHKFASLKSL